jgi:hypothetical protein
MRKSSAADSAAIEDKHLRGGGKVGPRTKTERDSQDIRRLLRAAGSRKKLFQWINEESLLEEFDSALLPGLAFMEETSWKHQRSPKPNAFIGSAS